MWHERTLPEFGAQLLSSSGFFWELEDRTGRKEDIGIKKYHQAALRRRGNNPNGEFGESTHSLYLTAISFWRINPLSDPSSVWGAVFRIVLNWRVCYGSEVNSIVLRFCACVSVCICAQFRKRDMLPICRLGLGSRQSIQTSRISRWPGSNCWSGESDCRPTLAQAVELNPNTAVPQGGFGGDKYDTSTELSPLWSCNSAWLIVSWTGRKIQPWIIA